MTKKKYLIEVYLKGECCFMLGDFVETIHRRLRTKSIGNFSPIFCTYKNKKCLVQSKGGDLSDPFRRTVSYLENLYIEI